MAVSAISWNSWPVATLKADRARRIALAAQGFCDAKPKGPVTVRQLRRVMDRMTILQLDSVNVLCRSHYLPVFARLGPYDRDKLNQYLYRSGEHFEYVSHEASITAQDHRPLLGHRMQYSRWKRAEKMATEVPEYPQAVLEEVAEHGPLSVKQLSDPGERTGPWWGMPKGKIALEWLYYTGRLAISERDHQFVTHYDLPERVLRPDVVAQPSVEEHEAKRQLALLGVRSHGIGTAADIADYFRLKTVETRNALDDAVAAGELERVDVQGWDQPAYLDPAARQPRSVSGRALLSPFDPVVWFRPRAERMFNFHYRIEIYVPESKRVFGYYVLPFLLDGELVGRVDLKADRQAGILRVRGSYHEEGVAPSRVAPELHGALNEMASWLDLDSVQVESEGNLAAGLKPLCG